MVTFKETKEEMGVFFLIIKTTTKNGTEERTWNSSQVNLEFSNIDGF